MILLAASLPKSATGSSLYYKAAILTGTMQRSRNDLPCDRHSTHGLVIPCDPIGEVAAP